MNYSKYKVISKYLSSAYLSIPVSIIVGFIAFRSIDPVFMGIWSALTIFETYATFLRLGIVNGMNRELPFAMGKGNNELAKKFGETTLAYTLTNIVFFVFIIIIFSIFSENSFYYRIGIIVAGLRIILSFYITFVSATFRSENSFNSLSNIQIIVLISKIALSPIILIGFEGYLIYELIIVMLNAILLHRYRPIIFRPQFHKKEFLILFKIGFPIFATSYILSFMETLPRLYIVKYGNTTLLGLYSPIFILLSTFALLPNTLSTYLYPKLTYQFGKNMNIGSILKKILKLYWGSFIVILILSVSLYFLVDYFMIFFPKYKESTKYIKIALFVCPFVMYKLGYTFLVIIKNLKSMIFFVLIYGVIQLTSLLMFRLFYKDDVLLTVIYSQLLTAIFMILIGLFFQIYYSKKSANFNKL